jgi:amino acid adenylation domain-containing protein
MSTDGKEIGFGQGSLGPVALDATRECIHECFEHQVARNPRALALRDATCSLTYDELNRRANRVAHRLRLHGVGPDVLVGLCLPRGCDLLVGALGILKAGGAYVALDAAHPAARLAQLVAEAGIGCVVTNETASEAFTDGPRCLMLDEGQALASFSDANPARGHAGSRSLAYAVYTSGSTGKPKASLLEHRGLCHMAAEQARVFVVTPASRVLQFASFAFDAATFEWVMALAHGASLYLPDEPTVKSPRALTRFVAEHGITHATLPPVILPLLEVEAWRGVQTLIVAGEAVTRELAETWSAGRAFFNAYGPSEMTVWCTTGRFVPGQAVAHIGTPVRHCACHVLDAAGAPVPDGEAGELHLAGAGIARGYLHRPDATAARFVLNTLSPERSPRMFRTGDRVRRLADGNLEFLGRVDRQIKVRGHRVEPEEIERCLARHPAVMSAAVEPQAWMGGLRLVAYVSVDEASAEQGALAAETGSQWQQLFDRAYRQMPQSPQTQDAFADFTGWHSSFTRAPIPADVMNDWVETTVARIRTFAPRRVLEIGCGAGLLLSRLVRDCEHYVATDISAEVIQRLASNLALLGPDARKVELLTAGQAEGALGARRFDTIIVNSVIHYFPHEAHLRAQLAALVARLEPGGVLFIGDVRNLAWNERFHADVEGFQSPPGAVGADFEARVRARVQNDKELVVAPELFLDAARSLSVDLVQLLPKLGRQPSEMNVYRYDAVLRRAGTLAVPAGPRAIEHPWSVLGSLAAVEALLREAPPADGGALIIRDVPYARLRGDGVDPVEWTSLADLHGLNAELALGTGPAAFHYHVLLRHAPASDALTRQLHLPSAVAAPFCNRPLLKRARRALESALRAHLRERLPPYLQPAAFVFLESLPVTSNGKVDRDALPAPVPGAAAGGEALSQTQQRLRDLWVQLLGQPDIGPGDHFHALGGDSLSAVRLLDSIQAEFGVEIEFAELQQALTLAGLAERIDLGLAQRALETHARAAAASAREVLRL